VADMLKNPWVIGILSSVIAGLILLRIGKARSSTEKENKAMSFLSPGQVIRELDKLPPLQRESAAKSYDGIPVSLEVTLEDAFHDPTMGKPRIIMLHKRNYQISTFVDLEQYPEFRVMKKGHKFRVEAEIASAALGDMTLKNCKFYF